MGCYAALAGVNDLPARGLEDLAGYLGAVETGVGTQGGSQDHVAILCSRPNELGQYSFRPVRHERQVPLPRDHVFVVAVRRVAPPQTGAARGADQRVAPPLGRPRGRARVSFGGCDAARTGPVGKMLRRWWVVRCGEA